MGKRTNDPFNEQGLGGKVGDYGVRMDGQGGKIQVLSFVLGTSWIELKCK